MGKFNNPKLICSLEKTYKKKKKLDQNFEMQMKKIQKISQGKKEERQLKREKEKDGEMN